MSRPSAARRSAGLRRIHEAIALLDERERHVLALLLVERLTVLEAAGTLHITMREVGEIYATALQRLARGTRVRPLRRAA